MQDYNNYDIIKKTAFCAAFTFAICKSYFWRYHAENNRKPFFTNAFYSVFPSENRIESDTAILVYVCYIRRQCNAKRMLCASLISQRNGKILPVLAPSIARRSVPS